MIEAAASAMALPFEFLARLIWQESKFNPQAVSPAGAQGIAQFMPKTADGRGLANPFEPAAALQESAEFLRELRDRFGNLGLAAAAYNAGPKRVQDWLAKRGPLPRETEDYVQIITGHRAEKWTGAEPPPLQEAALQSFRCADIATLVAQRRNLAVIERLANLVVQRSSHSRGETLPTRAAQAGSQPRSETRAAPASPPRSSARSAVLAQRSPPSPIRGMQAAKPLSRHQVERIIKITALSRNQPHVEIVTKDVAQSRKHRQGEKVAHGSAQTRPVTDGQRNGDKAAYRRQLAGNESKAGSSSQRAEKKTAARLPERRSADVSKMTPARRSAPPGMRMAATSRTGAEKTCSQAKGGGRKSCRAT